MLPVVHARKIAATVAATTGIAIFALAPHASAAASSHASHDAHLVHCGNDTTAPSCTGVDTAAAAQAAQVVNAGEQYLGYKFNIAQLTTAVDAQVQVDAATTTAQQTAIATAAFIKIKAEATPGATA